MALIDRPLTGYIVNVSISGDSESAERGFPAALINHTTVQIARALLGQGASVLFGHDWREDGVMEAVYSFARQRQSVAISEQGTSKPALLNILPWPDVSYLEPGNLEQLAETVSITSAGLPLTLTDFGNSYRTDPPESEKYRYLRARGLTHLRHELTARCDARLCMGGRRKVGNGRYPGIVEEALFALRSSKPLYVSSLLGGASLQLIEAFKGRRMPEDFCVPSSIAQLYERNSHRILLKYQDKYDDEDIDREAVWQEFLEAGVRTVASRTRLSENEMLRLFESRSLDEIIELILMSLSRLRLAS